MWTFVKGGAFPAPLEPSSKAQVMPPGSRLPGWGLTAASTGKTPCSRADGSKEIKYNGVGC